MTTPEAAAHQTQPAPSDTPASPLCHCGANYSALTTALEQCAAALEPFAEKAEGYVEDESQSEHRPIKPFTLAHIRAARDAFGAALMALDDL